MEELRRVINPKPKKRQVIAKQCSMEEKRRGSGRSKAGRQRQD